MATALNTDFPTPWRFAENAKNIATGGNGAYTVPTTGSADDINAAMTRAQHDRYVAKIQPIEKAGLKQLMDPATAKKAADRAVQTVDTVFANTNGMERREMTRFGVRPTGGQIAETRRHNGLDAALAKAGAWNKTYQGVDDIQTQGLADAISIGKGVAGQAMQGAGTAAGLENSRNMANMQREQAQESSMYSTIASGAGLGLSAGLAGVAGLTAATGAGWGAAAGLLLAFI